MMAREPTCRSTLNVELGPALDAALRQAAASQGCPTSKLVRALLHQALRSSQPEAAAAIEPAPGADLIALVASASNRVGASDHPGPAKAIRLAIDAPLAAELEAYKRRGQFRTRPAALRFALRAAQCAAHSLGDQGSGHGARHGPDQHSGQGAKPSVSVTADPTPLKDAVAALVRSNHELAPIGTNINQIARLLNSMHTPLRDKQAKQLEVFVGEVREHVVQASRVSSALRTMLGTFKP